MREIEYNCNTYRVTKLNTKEQWHIARRVMPLMGELVAATQNGKDTVQGIAAVANALAQLSDEQADYVLFGLLKSVQRKQENGLGWGVIATGTTLQYADIDFMGMLRLAAESFMENFSGFFQGLPSALNAATPTANDA